MKKYMFDINIIFYHKHRCAPQKLIFSALGSRHKENLIKGLQSAVQ